MSPLPPPQHVIVTDVRMPFWSMVVFMVKWAIAAIPAMLILAIVGGLIFTFFAGLGSSPRRAASVNFENTETASPAYAGPSLSVQTTPAPVTGNFDGVPARCKGSPEQDKCIESERRLAAETPEQRAARQNALEAERNANLANVK